MCVGRYVPLHVGMYEWVRAQGAPQCIAQYKTYTNRT